MNSLILSIIILFSPVVNAQSETAGSSNAMQELVNRSRATNASDRFIWGGEFEYNQVPALLETFFQDADCTFEGGASLDMNLAFIPENDRLTTGASSGHLVCQMRYGKEVGAQKFKLCQNAAVTCNSIVGGLRKENIVYPVKDGENCNLTNARQALLTSFQSTPGGYNVIPGSN